MLHKPRRIDENEALLCVSGLFKNVACFDPETLCLKYEIPTPKMNFRVISIPPEDGREEELIAVGDDFEVLLHSPHQNDSPFRKLSCSHSSAVHSLSYVSSRLIVSGSDEHPELIVSDVNSGEKVMDLRDAPKCTSRITSASQRQEEGRGGAGWGSGFVFVGGGDHSGGKSIRHYDLGRSERGNKVIQKFEGHAGLGLGYSTEKNLLFSSSRDRTLRVCSVQDGTCLHTSQLSNPSHSLLFDPKKRLIFCGVRGGIIEVWDPRKTKKRVRKFNHPSERPDYLQIWDLTQIGDGKYASVGSQDHSVVTWTHRGKVLATAKTSGYNYGVCFVSGTQPTTAGAPHAEAGAPHRSGEDGDVIATLRAELRRKEGSLASMMKARDVARCDAEEMRAERDAVAKDRDAYRQRLEQSDAKLSASEQARKEETRVNQSLQEELALRVSERDAALSRLRQSDSLATKLSRELAMVIGSPSSVPVPHLIDEDILTIRAHHPYGPFTDAFRKIGRGSYATVYSMVWKGRPVALKAMNGVEGDAEEVADSMAALQRARHPNLSELLAYSSKAPYCLVSELYHKTVAEVIEAKQAIDWKIKIKIIQDTALGMCHLHACPIVHRDLKWHNVMISHPLSHPECRAVVIDFGCVWIRGTSGRSELPGQGGTVGYKPPEIYELGAKAVTFPADVYAFGIMMYELLGETMEAYGPDFPMGDPHLAVYAAKQIVEGQRPDAKALQARLSPDKHWIARLMQNCWSADPLRRFTFHQIAQRLREEEGENVKKKGNPD